jgi:putative ABC transport system permease protein
VALWRQLRRGGRTLWRGDRAAADLADEVRHFLDEAAAAHEARGLAPDEALRAARLDVGTVSGVTEQMRAYGWENVVVTAWSDLRYAARRLASEPAFTGVVALTLAVGIGATTAIFSAANPILFESLPYPSPDRIATIVEGRADGGRNGGTFAIFREFVDRARTLDAAAVVRPWQPTLVGSGEPERLDGQRVSASYFRVLGVSPAVGRAFDASDDRAGVPNVVLLSDALWRRRFGADRAIVGRAITLDDAIFTVVGVMPPSFENVLAPSAELWMPLQYDMTQGRAWGHHLRTLVRLRPGVSAAGAAQEIDAIGRAFVAQHRDAYGETEFIVTRLQDEVTRGVRPALLVILAAAGLVLVIACVNVTNLLLARGVQRRPEFALRAALGAGGGRLVRQLLTESLLLAAIGGAAGIAVAQAGVRALVALSPPGLPRVGAIAMSATALGFGVAITTVVALAFGVAPARQAAHSDPHRDLQHGWRRGGGGHLRTRTALVVAEVALALVLLVASGLLLRSLERLFAIDSGFRARGLLTMQVQISARRFADPREAYRFFAQALDAARRVPGVEGAALTSQLPLSGDRDEYGAHFEATPRRDAATYSVFRYAVSPGYFDTVGIPVRAGRGFDDRDLAGVPLVAVISDSLARQRFGAESPIGQTLRIGPTEGAPYTIVGVVGDVKQLSLALNDAGAVYIPASAPAATIRSGQWQFADTVMSLVVRTRGDGAALAPMVRQAVWSVNRDQPIVRVARLDALVAASAAERRFALVLFEAFALAALVLAAAGIYGVLAGSVAERTREIGVRAALGASRADILALVVRQAMQLTGWGVVAGLAVAAVATRAIAAMLFGVSRLDPITYASVVLVLTAVAAAASGIPAWRAVRVDPATTLRAE